jgi:type III secretory pathway component EscV/tetratricopeptide (TPR) repeat protein
MPEPGEEIAHLLDIWQSLDDQVGHSTDGAERETLIARRSRVIDELTAAHIITLAEAARRAPDRVSNEWLESIARAVSLFRLRLAFTLASHDDLAPRADATVALIRQGTHAMLQSRWIEAYEAVRKLSEVKHLPDLVRARLLVVLGQIQLYRLFRTDAAKQLIESARTLAPHDGRVLAALGDCFARVKDTESAREFYQRAIESSPDSPAGYVGLGEQCEEAQQIDEAERWYRQAMSASPGSSTGYLRLLRLFGRRELFVRHRHELEPLIERIIAIAQDDQPQAWLELGRVYLENGLEGDAQRCYDEAIAVDPSAPEGYLAVAGAREKQQRFDEAVEAYLAAIKVAPLAYEAHLGLAFLYEQRQQWDKALAVWQNFPPHVPEWAELARVRTGTALLRLGDLDSAERTLKAALLANKSNKAAKHALEELAEEYHSRRGDKAAALRIYEELLAIVGDWYRPFQLDRIGHLHLADGDTERAFQYFNQAIALDPRNATFYRSLGQAHETLKDYGKAAAQYEAAKQIDGDVERYNTRMSLLRNTEANDAYASGDYPRAVGLYEQAIAFAPENAVMLSNLANAYERSADPGIQNIDKAIEALERASAIAPSEDYRSALERLRRKRELTAVYTTKTLAWIPVVTPIALEVAGDLITLAEGGSQGGLSPEMAAQITELRSRLKRELGVPVPGVRVRGNEADLPDGTYIIMLLEVPLVSGNARPNERFCVATEAQLTKIGASGTPGTDPLSRREGYWLTEQQWDAAASARLERWDARAHMIRHLESVLRRNLVEFVGFEEVLTLVDEELPGISEQLHADVDKLTSLVTVCRALAGEEVPLGPFVEVWRAFDHGYTAGDPLEVIVESIRRSPAIRQRLPGADRLGVAVDQSVQNEIANSIQVSGPHSLLAMEPTRCQEVLTSVRNTVADNGREALVVDDASIRPHLRRLVELEWPDLPVVARDEMSNGMAIDRTRIVELDAPVAPQPRPVLPRRAGMFPGVQREGLAPTDPTSLGITIFISDAFTKQRNEADDEPLDEMLAMMSDGLFYELGLMLPEVRVVIDNRLPIDSFSFTINGRPHSTVRGLQPDEFLVNDTPDRLTLLRIAARAAVNPASGAEAAIVRSTDPNCSICRQAGLTVWGPAGYLVLTLVSNVRANAPSFVTREITQYMLDSHRAAFPDLDAAVQQRFTIEQIQLLLQQLLEEEISVRDLRSILTNIALVNGTSSVDLSRYIVFRLQTGYLCFPRSTNVTGLDIADYVEMVRGSLKKQISHKYTRGGNTLVVYLMDPEIEAAITKSGERLREPDRGRLMMAMRNELRDLPPTATKPVILTTLDVRKPLWKLLRNEFPGLAVVSYQELSPDLNIQPIARLTWAPPLSEPLPISKSRSAVTPPVAHT